MLKRFRIPEIILGAYLTIAVLAIGFAFGSLPHSGQVAEQRATELREAWWHDATAVFTLGLVIVGLAQAILFYVQLQFIRESLGPAKEAADAAKDAASAAKLNAQVVIDGQRAHLFVKVVRHDVVETIQASNRGRHDASIEAIVMQAPILAYTFTNAGKTPAILEEVMHSVMLEKTEKHTIQYEMPERAIEVLGEGQRSDQIAVTFDARQFCVRDAIALGDHDLMLFFYSAATYRDIHNRQHKIRHDFLYSAGTFHLINRIEKTIEPQERNSTEGEQSSKTGFFGRPSEAL
ncbi:hypothetical protein [Bradyrhizobium sp. HKCCYLRH3083]|uniref:hypothetical protein n=1 Tax=unclassified Bradyrhizobium TaxID=2631580 RepID=UPI003EC08034